tara:strand:+ start:148 stop:600 length:453 start_codon:yes stop_codon:yes gene_type:complete
MVDLINQKYFVNKHGEVIMAKFDTEKRDKIVKVLERTWLHTLKTPSSRTMIADLITKELFGDDEGILNNTPYGDNPITPAAKIKSEVIKEEEVVDLEVSEKEVVEPIVQKEKPVVSRKKTKTKDIQKPKRRTLKTKTPRRKKDGISRFSK